jgi:hypothetical protein
MAQRGMKFGIFLAPFHRLGENPTLAMARDMELIDWLDYDEAWIGAVPDEYRYRTVGTSTRPRRRQRQM